MVQQVRSADHDVVLFGEERRRKGRGAGERGESGRWVSAKALIPRVSHPIKVPQDTPFLQLIKTVRSPNQASHYEDHHASLSHRSRCGLHRARGKDLRHSLRRH